MLVLESHKELDEVVFHALPLRESVNICCLAFGLRVPSHSVSVESCQKGIITLAV